MKLKTRHIGWIIHLFALLHAVVALVCRMTGIADGMLLTVLTMAMALLVCIKKNLSLEFTAAVIIVVNIIGYLMGVLGANLLLPLFRSEYLVHSISTAATTEILGWSIVAVTKIFHQEIQANAKKRGDSPQYAQWIMFSAGGILLIRLIVVLLFSRSALQTEMIFEAIGEVMSNSVAMIMLICMNLLFVRAASKRRHTATILQKAASLTIFTLLSTLAATAIISIGLPFNTGSGPVTDFRLTFIVALMAQITVYCIVFMANYALSVRSEMHKEREKANIAQYRYVKLKHQMNPHFLFNSLNILDCLICDENTEAASAYTHKLAGIYRYMLKSEDEMIVPMRDELVFVGLYVDLLKERFPSGFSVEIAVPEEMMARFVLPCSIQLLIENATKHNAVSEDYPLIIKVETNGGNIQVTNNLVPKVTRSPSTGLGQTYIKQMYLDLTGKDIGIEKTDDIYRVTLPLI